MSSFFESYRLRPIVAHHTLGSARLVLWRRKRLPAIERSRIVLSPRPRGLAVAASSARHSPPQFTPDPERDVASDEAVPTAPAASLVGRHRLQGAAAAGGGALGERGLRAAGAGRAGVAVEPHGLPLLPRPRRRSACFSLLRRRAHPLPHPYARLFFPLTHLLLRSSSITYLVIREIMLQLI